MKLLVRLAVTIVIAAGSMVAAPAPARALSWGLGDCTVWASSLHRIGGYVIGYGSNECSYPASVALTEGGVEWKVCRLGVFCYWTPAVNMLNPSVGRPGLQRDTVRVQMRWQGARTYRLYVEGSCFNCRSRLGGVYGAEVKLR